MVVANLESFVEKEIPGALYLGNLKDLINRELQEGRGRPTVVLDESAIPSIFLSGVIYGDWQPNDIKNEVENFVENIISCGADLIVVLRGTYSKSVAAWFCKSKQRHHQMKKELDAFLEGNVKPCQFQSRCCPRNTFVGISNDHYRVLMSVEYAHKEVAEIAVRQNCLAVIGQDSNYLIYEGIKHYIPTKSVNVKTLECKIYDREKLLEHLGLKSCHLPLFATLCGNDEINVSYLVSFHKKMSHPIRNKFLCISELAKCFSGDPYEHINTVVKLINHTNVEYTMVKKSLDMYLNFEKIVPENKWLGFANERKKMYKWSDSMYEIFTLKEFRSAQATSLGHSCTLLPPKMLRPLRRNIYAILFYEDDDPVVSEYCLEEMPDLRSCEFPTPTIVVAGKLECEHPGLIQLYDENAPEVHSLRWNLFCSSLGRTLTPFMVRSVPPKLLWPVLALHYLETEVPRHFGQNVFRKKFEVETFLVVAVLVYERMQDAPLANYRFRPDERVTSLIFYVLAVNFTLNLLNEACGLVISCQESCICNFFDGILVHCVYEKMRKGTKWHEFFPGNSGLRFLFTSLMEFIRA